MHFLHRALEEDGRLQTAVLALSDRIRRNPLKSGILLDLNPFWITTYRAVEAGLSEQAFAFYWWSPFGAASMNGGSVWQRP